MLRCAPVLLALSLMLAGCGSTASNQPASSSSGAVMIRTDRTTYAPGDAIAVTVHNGRTIPIYGTSGQSSCSLLSLQYHVNGVWQPSQAAPCVMRGIPAFPVQINAGANYSASIYLFSSRTFPGGSYRLVLLFATTSEGQRTTLVSTVPLQIH